jgi:pimeloyl-ACP methyl ester carboxylesterase
MIVREHGETGPLVIVLHGGPAAVGDVAPLARGLAASFRALEPWQRGSGDAPLTVAQHVADLRELVAARAAETPPAIVGHSWGAMLALCYAAAHPSEAGPLVLVGSGTFDQASRDAMKAIFRGRTDAALQRRLDDLAATVSDRAELHMRKFKLTRDLSVYARAEPWPDALEYEALDVRAHNETWQDVLRLLADGTYPRAFAAIRSPVLMLHGDYDPHPGRMIRDALLPFLPQLEHRELARCGHSPWLETFARDEFFAVLTDWLARHARIDR